MDRLRSKVALITGAASGIGAACALRFAREAAAIGGLDVAAPTEEAWKAVRDAAPRAEFLTLDVRDESQVEAAVARMARSLGRIDVLVNAAGVSGVGPVDSLEASEWDRVLDINLKGTFLVSKHVVKRMMAQGAGSIINLASVEGLEGMQQQAAYNASKGGVVLLTRNMAIDYGGIGIRVNCLCPGLIETPMTALLLEKGNEPVLEKFRAMHMLRRSGKPEEVAAAALFLASDDASFVTGHALAVDGGFSAGRRLVDEP